MNETLKTILNRRSFRAYKPEQIKDEEGNTGRYWRRANMPQVGVAPNNGTSPRSRKATSCEKINAVCRETMLRSGNKMFEEMGEGRKLQYILPCTHTYCSFRR